MQQQPLSKSAESEPTSRIRAAQQACKGTRLWVTNSGAVVETAEAEAVRLENERIEAAYAVHGAIRLLEEAHTFMGTLPSAAEIPEIDDDLVMTRLREGSAELYAAAEAADESLRGKEADSDESGADL